MLKRVPLSPGKSAPVETRGSATPATPVPSLPSASGIELPEWGLSTVLHRFGPSNGAEGAGGILALHGFSGSAQDFAPLAQPADGGVSSLPWVAPDLPGHGAARAVDPNRAYSFEATDALIARALDELPSGRRRLLGYSLGGRLALHFATRHPGAVDRLYLIGASPGLETARERESRHANDLLLASRIDREGMNWFAPFWESQPLIQTQARISQKWRKAMQARRRQIDAAALAHSLRGLGTGAMPSLWDRLFALDVPATLFVGEEDAKFLALGERIVSRSASISLVVIPNAGHCAHLENGAAFRQALQRCL